MKIRIMTLLASAALAMPAASLAADVPQRGMSQSQVRAEFGAPNQSKGPVGSPAITRWFYNGFTVYFENNTALHTVVDRPVSAAPDVVSGQQVDTLPPLQEKTAAQSSEPAPAATAENSEDKGGLMFDPVSGRFVSEDDSNSNNDSAPASSAEPKSAAAPAAATKTAPAASEPATAPTPAPVTPAKSTANTAATATAGAAATKAAPAPSAPAADTSDEGEFRFDPVTGRIIIAGEDTPEQAAKKKAASVEKEAQQSVDQASKSANHAVEDSQAKAQNAVDDANEKAEAAKAKAQQSVDEQVEQAEQTQQAAKDAANEAKDKADDGGFYIDWGARQ